MVYIVHLKLKNSKMFYKCTSSQTRFPGTTAKDVEKKRAPSNKNKNPGWGAFAHIEAPLRFFHFLPPPSPLNLRARLKYGARARRGSLSPPFSLFFEPCHQKYSFFLQSKQKYSFLRSNFVIFCNSNISPLLL